MKSSVVVATYNRPRHLRLCLMSLADSTVLPSEVLIADDGSTQETRDCVLEMQQSLKRYFPIEHVWQEHDGCRKQKIVNEAVRRSTGEYLIFTDGDCMVHRNFLQTHIERSDPNAVLAGQRVQIGKELSEELLENQKVLNTLGFRLLMDFLRRRSHHSKESILIHNGLLRRILGKDKVKFATAVIGTNFSLYKRLFLDINGYDEDFSGFGDEDADVGVRVINQGKQIQSVRNLAIVFHIFHPGTWDMSTEPFRHNAMIKRRRIENKEPYCRNGIVKLP